MPLAKLRSKGFDFPSTAANRRLEIQSPILARYTSRELLGDLTRQGYMAGANLEFIGVSKRTKVLETAEITVASETTKRYLLSTPILFDGHRLNISSPSADRPPNSNMPEALTTSILVRGLPVEYSQLQTTAALHKLLSPRNVLAVTYNRAEGDSLGRHDGVATIRCLNAAVYTHWCNRKGIPCLGKLVDFTPHSKSLAGAHPAAATKAQDSRPTREVIAEAITAFRNETSPTPTLQQFEASIQAVEGRLRNHISSVGHEITNHTGQKLDNAAAQATTHHNHIVQQLQLLASASRAYSDQMGGIFSALNNGPTEGPTLPSELLENNNFYD